MNSFAMSQCQSVCPRFSLEALSTRQLELVVGMDIQYAYIHINYVNKEVK